MIVTPFVVDAWKELGKKAGGIGNQMKNRDHQEKIVKIGENTQKSPGYPRRLVITQLQVKKCL